MTKKASYYLLLFCISIGLLIFETTNTSQKYRLKKIKKDCRKNNISKRDHLELEDFSFHFLLMNGSYSAEDRSLIQATLDSNNQTYHFQDKTYNYQEMSLILKNILSFMFYWENECIRSCHQDGTTCEIHNNIPKLLQIPWSKKKFKNNNLFWCIKTCPQDGNWCNAHECEKVLQSINHQKYWVNIRNREKEVLTNKILHETFEITTPETKNKCLETCCQDGNWCDEHQWVKFLHSPLSLVYATKKNNKKEINEKYKIHINYYKLNEIQQESLKELIFAWEEKKISKKNIECFAEQLIDYLVK